MSLNDGNSTRSNTSMATAKGLSQHTGIATKETGLSVSGSLVYDKAYVNVNCPAFTMIGSVLTFSGRIDLSAVWIGDVFEDNTSPTPVNYTIGKVDKAAKQITLSAVPTVLTAGGKIYKNKPINTIAVMGYSHTGSTSSGLDINMFDEDGQPYTFENPLPVQISQGSINVQNLEIDEVLVHLDHEDRDIVDYRGGWQSGAAPPTTLAIDYTANMAYVDNAITYTPGATITFSDNTPAADTILDSAGQFVIEGFTAGDTVVITGSVSNDGTYTIAAGGVAAGALTLEAADALTDELVGVAAVVYTNTPQDQITDAANQFVVEGFEAGQYITVVGTVSNDGTYLIGTVAIGTLTLAAGEDLTTEGAVATTMTVTGSTLDIDVDGDGAQTIDLTDYAQLNSGIDIAAAIQARVRDLSANSIANQASIDNFSCIYDSTLTMYRMWSGSWEGTSSVVATAGSTGSDVAAYLDLTAAAGGTAITEPNTHTVTGDSTRIGDGTDLMNVVIEDEDISSFDGGVLTYGESNTQTAKKFQCVEDADTLGAGEDKGGITYFKSAQLIYSATLAFVDSNPDTITDGSSGFIAAGFHEGMVITISGSASNNTSYTIDSVVAGTLTLIATDTVVVEGAVACIATVAPEMADTFNVAHQGEAVGNYGRGLIVYGRDVSNQAKAPEIVLEGGDLDGEAGDDGGFISYFKSAGTNAAARDIAATLHIATEDVDISTYDNGITIYGESVGQTAKMWQVLEDADVMAAGEDKGMIVYYKSAGATPEVADTLNVAMQADPLGTNGRGVVIYGRDVSNNAKALEIIADGGDLDAEAGDDAGFLNYFKSAGASAALRDIAATFHVATQDVDVSSYDNGVIVYGRKIGDTATVPVYVEEDDSIAGAGDDAGVMIYGESIDQTAKSWQVVEETDVLGAGEDKGMLFYAKSAGATPDVANTLNIATQGDALGTNDHGIIGYGRKIDDSATIPLFVEAGDSIAAAGDDAGVLMYGEAVDQTAKIHQVVEDGDTMAAGEDKGFITYFKSATATPEAADTFNVCFEGEAIGTNGRGVVIYGRDTSDNAKTLEFNAAGELIASSSNAYVQETLPITVTDGAPTGYAFSESPLAYAKASVQVVWDANFDNAATIIFQVSNDNTNWESLPIGVTNITAGVAGAEIMFSQDIPYAYIRMLYTETAPVTAGVLNCYLVLKS